MLQELQPAQFERVRSLFQALDYHLYLFAVIEGKSPGQIFVDDVSAPRVALIWDHAESGCYLGGDYHDPALYQALNTTILDTIRLQAKTRDLVEVVLNYTPDGWEEQLPVVLAGLNPLQEWRQHFVMRSPPALDWRAALPAGYTVCMVDEAFLARTDLKNIERLQNWNGSPFRHHLQALMGGALGCCVVARDTIASWCLGDCAAGTAVEVGIHTAEDYRQQGLATIAVAATVETCLANGATQVGWHCWSSNLASAATARKIGFQQTIEHPVYFAWFNPVDNWAVQGNINYLSRKDYVAATQAYSQAFRLLAAGHPDAADVQAANHPWTYYNAAGAWARLGKLEAALHHLQQAVDKGFTAVEHLQHNPDFVALHTFPQWSGLLAQLQTPTNQPTT